ncbi:MAG: DNA-deoxyinosine glycosylase [Gammaproteobacteria bacterium]
MSHIQSFPPISDSHASVLILGSIPGKASLRAGQYYAHPRNAFWRIMSHLLNWEPGLDYEEKCAALIAHRIALWDVLAACTRSSSLDSDIIESSIIPNDFVSFFDRHPAIRAVYFNGAKAESSYLKHVRPQLPVGASGLPVLRLPSTSPAHAAMSFQTKLDHWRVIPD